MQSAYELFRKNTVSARQMVGLFVSFRTTTTAALDTSDLLRNALVGAVSALDHLVHEVVRMGVLEIASGARPKAKGTAKFSVSLVNVIPRPSDFAWLDAEIRQKHGWLSFQDPDKIADAVRLISDCELWNVIASALGAQTPDIKNRLKLIVDRRNKIAHEADADPSAYGQKWPIDERMAGEAITFLEAVGEALYNAVKI